MIRRGGTANSRNHGGDNRRAAVGATTPMSVMPRIERTRTRSGTVIEQPSCTQDASYWPMRPLKFIHSHVPCRQRVRQTHSGQNRLDKSDNRDCQRVFVQTCQWKPRAADRNFAKRPVFSACGYASRKARSRPSRTGSTSSIERHSGGTMRRHDWNGPDFEGMSPLLRHSSNTRFVVYGFGSFVSDPVRVQTHVGQDQSRGVYRQRTVGVQHVRQKCRFN